MTAIITGASSGIGRELALLFGRDHHDLIITARSSEALETLATQLRTEYAVDVRIVTADLSESGGAARLVDAVHDAGTRIDYLINNAGYGVYGAFTSNDLTAELGSIAVNVAALTELTKRFLPPMIERGHGRILNVASTAAFQPGPSMAVYFATKAYVLSFSEALAYELRGTGVTMTCLCPGATETKFGERAGFGSSAIGGLRGASARSVAEYGYRALFAGETLAIHGVANRLLAFSTRLAPRSALPPIVERMITTQ